MRLLGKALTFDDVLLVPAYSQVLPKDTSLATQFSRNIQLNLPLVSAAMDTVTEARLAIAIAQEGGIGIIHKNLTAQEQAAHVAKVKRYESGVLRDPVVISPQTTIRQVMKLSDELGVSGFPVVDGGKVVGIVTGRDLRFETRYELPVSEIMTPRERLVTMPDGTTPAEAKTLLNKHKLERLLLVNDAFELKGLITVKDITKQLNFPNAARDAAGRLRVGAAVGVGEGTEERVEALVKAGVDAIVVDTAHGHSKGVIDRVRWVKQNYPQIDVIGGNIATGGAAMALVEAHDIALLDKIQRYIGETIDRRVVNSLRPQHKAPKLPSKAKKKESGDKVKKAEAPKVKQRHRDTKNKGKPKWAKGPQAEAGAAATASGKASAKPKGD